MVRATTEEAVPSLTARIILVVALIILLSEVALWTKGHPKGDVKIDPYSLHCTIERSQDEGCLRKVTSLDGSILEVEYFSRIPAKVLLAHPDLDERYLKTVVIVRIISAHRLSYTAQKAFWIFEKKLFNHFVQDDTEGLKAFRPFRTLREGDRNVIFSIIPVKISPTEFEKVDWKTMYFDQNPPARAGGFF